jgi:hypothetical protein
MIRPKTARRIAYEFHGGMYSGLYSYASSGLFTNVNQAMSEINGMLNHCDLKVDRFGNWFTDYFYTGKNRKELTNLLHFLNANK